MDVETTFNGGLPILELYAEASLSMTEDCNGSLVIVEDILVINKEHKNRWLLNRLQGQVLSLISNNPSNSYLKVLYLLGTASCFSKDEKLSGLCARELQRLAQALGSTVYYRACLKKAKQYLSLPDIYDDGSGVYACEVLCGIREVESKSKIESLVKEAEHMILASKTSSLKPEALNLDTIPELVSDGFKGLRLYWVGLDVNIKRELMKVSIEKLLKYAEGVYERNGRDVVEEAITCAKKDMKWKFWMCRGAPCSFSPKKFSSGEECKAHFEKEHDAGFEISDKRIGKEWARKINVGDWEPLDTSAAVEIINTHLGPVDKKAFAPKSGWSKEWPLAFAEEEDEERKKLLKEIKSLLVLFLDLKILSCSVRNWLVRFPVNHLGKFSVSEQSLLKFHLLETPQTICFLECQELCKIVDFLKKIKCKRNDGADLVCKAVDTFLSRTQVKEKIDFDPDCSFLLLDRRLLKKHYSLLDDEGKIEAFDPNVHYAKASAQGDDMISWLVDYSTVDKIFPIPIREQNLSIWLSVLRAVQFTCTTMGTKHAKKARFSAYDEALTSIKDLCTSQNDKRYAPLLCDRCEEIVLVEVSSTAKLFLCAVRDVLEGAKAPTYDFLGLEDCLNVIRERQGLVDYIVLESIDHLKTVVTHKVLLLDSEILLIDNSRISLLNSLTKLSVFDNRSYVLKVLKPFLLGKIIDMESKATSDAAKAYFLIEEEENKSQSQTKKKKNNKNSKRTSPCVSSPFEKTHEDEPADNLEPESTSPPLITVEEDNRPTEFASNTDKADNDMRNMPELEQDSLSEYLEPAHGEAVTRYNSALDMILKAVLNIKAFKEDLMHNKKPFNEEQVPIALQDLFSAYLLGEIEDKGFYGYLLAQLLASFEVVHAMPGSADQVLVSILEFWHCWKNEERESLVTRLFTIEEYERMSCRQCRRKPNYQEQGSYGIVVAADSIRDLKCAFGDIKFVDVLKLIRMLEYKMVCDTETGGCGETNFVHRVISICPPIFIILLEWEKSETDEEIYKTVKALEYDIDLSRLYDGLERNTTYRLVSMVCCGSDEEEEEEKHVCIAYEKTRWVLLERESLKGEVVGNWKSVISFCGERKVRPQILFYESARS
ncbi:unnamed protein product [Cochlearia groenlandica]